MRLAVMPLIIVAVALWISSWQGRDAAAQSDRVRVVLTQILEEMARDPSGATDAFAGSQPILVETFRSRLRREAESMATRVPLVDVRLGDFGTGSLGDATHTALACYAGSAKRIAVRVIARSENPQVILVGVFTPTQSEFVDGTPIVATTP